MLDIYKTWEVFAMVKKVSEFVVKIGFIMIEY